jgi:hypothetical protein
MLPAILGIAKAGLGVAGSIAGHSNAVAQARAQNKAAMERYKYQLKIRERENLNQNQLWATKISQYGLEMKAADKSAARAYGVEDLKQSQRIKSAAFSTQKLNRAMAKSAGVGAASGKSGRSVERSDANILSQFARNQAMITENLMGAEAARQYREMGIADQLTSYRNRAYSNVAIAPTVSETPLAPTQLATPSAAGAMIGAASSVLGAVGGFMNNQAPNPGDMFGGGGGAPDLLNSNIDFNIGSTPFGGNYTSTPSFMGSMGSSFFGT